MAKGIPYLSVCGGIFKNDKACHVANFCAYLNLGAALVAEISATMIAIEHWKGHEVQMEETLDWIKLSHCCQKLSLILVWFHGRSNLVGSIVCPILGP